MAAAAAPQQLSRALLSFSNDGRFPEDIATLPPVTGTDLAPAIEALSGSAARLQESIHEIEKDTEGEVSSWAKHAKALQEDIIRTKTIANDIVRQSEAPDVSGETIEDAETKVNFVNSEVQYSNQLVEVLKAIRRVNQALGEVEKASQEKRILDALRLLESRSSPLESYSAPGLTKVESWDALDNVGVSRSCRVVKLLDIRAFELKSDVHDVFDRLWKAMIEVDVEAHTLSIHTTVPGAQMSLGDAVIGLKAYKEVDERMEQLWRNVNAAVIGPRMDRGQSSVPRVVVDGDVLKLEGQAETSVADLLTDLETVASFIAGRIPLDLLASFCGFMMGDLVPVLTEKWLDPAVPSSLQNMQDFEQMIQIVKKLCTALEGSGFSDFEPLSSWADKAPMIWLNKCRENALDLVRQKLTKGIGAPKQVEKVEKHMVPISEGNELATVGAGAAADTNDWGADWGDAWDEDDEGDDEVNDEKKAKTPMQHTEASQDDGADAWGWDDGDGQAPAEADDTQDKTEEDESAEAWGWGDGDEEDTTKQPPTPQKKQRRASESQEAERELIMKETYHISSMPEPVLELIFAILEDGAALTQEGEEYAHVAATAPGLFSLPTFALALFRAISPYYYSLDVGGNMFLYNDAKYLAEKLTDFSTEWKQREDLTPKARNMLRLDNDIRSLQSFANRSYMAEMDVQKTVLRDLLGGAQSLVQQDETEAAVDSGVARIRSMATVFERILPRSVWCQAIGSLADALATKLITDVLEMSSIGQDEAYNLANLIATATDLDDLFLKSKWAGSSATHGAADETPSTAYYARNWERLKCLSRVLQSNLREMRQSWLDGDLSLFFTAEEVVDLIRASFENNQRAREVIREVQSKPQPQPLG